MGNRANVIFVNEDETSISPTIYLHWNGGPESIYAFLDELDRRNIREDQCYEAARFVQLVGEFSDQDSISGLSLGIMNGPKKITPEDLGNIQTDNANNGFYIVDRTDRKKRRIRRFKVNYEKGDHPLEEMPKEEVEKEIEAAYKHFYNTGKSDRGKVDTIAKCFLKITKGKKIEEHR